MNIPYPIVLVVAGLLLSFLPRIPRIALNPEVVFLVVLPPLLYSGAWLTSWRDFKFNLVSILLLAFGLVGFTRLGSRKQRGGCSRDSTGGWDSCWARCGDDGCNRGNGNREAGGIAAAHRGRAGRGEPGK